MPELPEVETIRRSLEPHLLGRTVISAALRRRDMLVSPGDPRGGFARARGTPGHRPRRVSRSDLLEGATIASLLRHGKQLAIIADDGRCLVIQLGMSGQLLIGDGGGGRDHVHAVWRISESPLPEGGERGGRASIHGHGRSRVATEGEWTSRVGQQTREPTPLPPPSGRGCLLFRDPRRFGALRSFPTRAALEAHWSDLGPDALDIEADRLADALAGTSSPIKAALLNQAVLAGVGNIYADESLFGAGIHPLTRSDRLTGDRVGRLAASIRSVLARAICAGGSTLRDYLDGNGDTGRAQESFLVYGRAGMPCTRCGAALVAIQAGQRTTVFCRRCQARSSPRARTEAGRAPQLLHRRPRGSPGVSPLSYQRKR